MIKFRIVYGFVLASILLGACASQGVNLTPEAPAAQSDQPPGDAIYDVLVGEIAGQRGQWPIAATHYLHAAQTTHSPAIAERATRVAFLAGDTKAGLEAARLWLTLQPNNNEAHQSLAILLLRNGETVNTLTELETLLANLRPHGAEEAYTLVAALLAREKDPDAVLGIMSTLVDRAGRYQPEALIALGRLALQTKRFAVAMESLDKALRARPGLIDAMILRARVLQIQGKREAALHYLGDVLKTQPNDHPLRLAYGRALIDAAQFDQAREQFTVLAHQDPNNGDVLFALGILCLQANQDAQAKQQFLRLIDLKQRTQEAAFYLGQLAETHKRTAEAMKWYRSINGGDNALDAHIRLAVLIARQGDLAAARDHLHSIEPQDTAQSVRLVLTEADLLTDAGRLEESMEILSRAITELPDNADLLYAHAMTAERMNKISILEEDLTTILSTDPNHVQALNALGYTLADRTKRFQDALGYIQRALALRPKDFYILDSMGWVQYRLGNHAEAVRYLEQAIALRDDPEVAAHLGEVLWVMGNHKEARKVWQHAMKRDPNSKVVREAMDHFNEH